MVFKVIYDNCVTDDEIVEYIEASTIEDADMAAYKRPRETGLSEGNYDMYTWESGKWVDVIELENQMEDEELTAFVVIRTDPGEDVNYYASKYNHYTRSPQQIRFWNTREEAEAFAAVDEMNMHHNLGDQHLYVKEVKIK